MDDKLLAGLIQIQMTDLGQMHVAMNRFPSPDLEMIEAQLVLVFLEASFD